MMKKRLFTILIFVTMIFVCTGCSGKKNPVENNKPTEEVKPQLTATPVPTEEPTPVPTEEVTVTPEPITATPEPTEEVTATPEPIIEVEYPVLNPHTEEELLAELDKLEFNKIIFVVWENDYSVKFFTEGDVLLDEYYDFIYIYHPEDVLTINTSLDQYAELSQKSSKVHKNITGHYNLNTIEYNVNCETNGNKYEASVNLTINVPEYTETLN